MQQGEDILKRFEAAKEVHPWLSDEDLDPERSKVAEGNKDDKRVRGPCPGRAVWSLYVRCLFDSCPSTVG